MRGYGGRADAYHFLKQYDNAIADYKQVRGSRHGEEGQRGGETERRSRERG